MPWRLWTRTQPLLLNGNGADLPMVELNLPTPEVAGEEIEWRDLQEATEEGSLDRHDELWHYEQEAADYLGCS